MTHRFAVRATVAVALLSTVGAAGAAAALQGTPYRVVTVRHAPTGFSMRAPQGFGLSLRNGVYVLQNGGFAVSFTRLDTRVSPAQFGTTLLRALGGRVLVRAGDNRHFVAAVAGSTRNDHFVVERVGSRLLVTTSTTSTGAPVALETLRQMGLSARGGVGMRASRAAPSASPIPLRPYRAPDGGATALVPVGCDVDSREGNFLWNFYYSGIGVPSGSSPSVGVGLLRAWRSWNPSGAIAARTRAAARLINETNQIWQETTEFRSRIADQQSRDVGCLLSGYYLVEDNARRYGLPPLPCGQIYTERD